MLARCIKPIERQRTPPHTCRGILGPELHEKNTKPVVNDAKPCKMRLETSDKGLAALV